MTPSIITRKPETPVCACTHDYEVHSPILLGERFKRISFKKNGPCTLCRCKKYSPSVAEIDDWEQLRRDRTLLVKKHYDSNLRVWRSGDALLEYRDICEQMRGEKPMPKAATMAGEETHG